MAKAHEIPVVVLDRATGDPTVDVVRCDPIGGSSNLARLLLWKGHKQFAILAGHPGVSTTEERIEAFAQVLREAGMTESVSVFYGDFTIESGVENARKAMTLEPRPTAIFATNNFISIGALRALQSMGVRVPEDIALVGFDDLPPDMVVSPFLTVVGQPAYEMGRRAVEQLFRRIHDPHTPPQEIVLQTEVVVRGSSG